MPKLDLTQVPVKSGSIYPSPYKEMVAGRSTTNTIQRIVEVYGKLPPS